MFSPDPVALARWQLDRDRAEVAHFPGLLEQKLAKMTASPLAFLRGTAPLFHRLLAEHAELSEGPSGEGWICGDAHLENFGVFRTDGKKNASGEEPVVFDVNDFDETVIGPFRLDVLRLVTSLILGGRELGADGKRSLSLSTTLLDAYSDAAWRGVVDAPPPPSIVRLMEKAAQRTKRDLLAGRVDASGGALRFIRGDRYSDLDGELAEKVRAAFAGYAARFGEPERFEVRDVAFRIAGNGSLGRLRVAVLTRGKGGDDGAFLFDMKEEGTPASARVVPVPEGGPAARVLAGISACLERPPRLLGVARLDAMELLVRRLAPQEDKLNLEKIGADELPMLAAHLGALLGRAHHRGAAAMPGARWSAAERQGIVERAVALAGVHEAAYLALCQIA